MTSFTRWMQFRLNLHGAEIVVDGAMGPLTRSALRTFQAKAGLKINGSATKETIDALRLHPDPHVTVVDNSTKETMPPWLEEMTRRMGLHEKRNNVTLSEWLRSGKFLGNPAKLPWCGDAVETCFSRALPEEPLPSNPFWAQDWAKFGRPLDGPRVGAVGVIRWSAKAGHVGFVIDYSKHKVKLRGGNQSNMIRDDWFNIGVFIAFRWPHTYPIRDYPRIIGEAGTNASTR